MNHKRIPERLKENITHLQTPFYIYDEQGIVENARKFYDAFSWAYRFKNYFAVKALPNPYILRILKEEGMGFDCSSGAELEIMNRMGYSGEEDIIFTSNNTPLEEFKLANTLKAIVNFDDISHIDGFIENICVPDFFCLRYNPGNLKKGNVIIGNPEEAKFGFTKKDAIAAYRMMKERGSKRFGLHCMVASNELDETYFEETARILFEFCVELYKQEKIRIDFVNLGGGFGIPYSPEEKPIDYHLLSSRIKKVYDETILKEGLDPMRIVTENGRCITGPYGWLVSKVRHIKDTYKKFVGLDANMSDLMRPGMYGAYHHITVLNDNEEEEIYDVTGSLCENNDKFAINRKLKKINIGDTVLIHDTGAHGHSMGFNYNGKLRSAEYLLTEKNVVQIRRAETYDDLFSTIYF